MGNTLASLLKNPSSLLGLSLLDELRIAYANAMWSWAEVEGDLFMIYVAATDGYRNHLKATQESYFSIISTKTRLDMTNAAACAKWAKTQELETWGPLYKRCTKELRTRGRIAHLTGFTVQSDKPHQKEIAVVGEHFWHPEHAASYQQAKNLGVSASQLAEFAVKWSELHEDMANFSAKLWETRMQELSLRPRPQSAEKSKIEGHQ